MGWKHLSPVECHADSPSLGWQTHWYFSITGPLSFLKYFQTYFPFQAVKSKIFNVVVGWVHESFPSRESEPDQ